MRKRAIVLIAGSALGLLSLFAIIVGLSSPAREIAEVEIVIDNALDSDDAPEVQSETVSVIEKAIHSANQMRTKNINYGASTNELRISYAANERIDFRAVKANGDWMPTSTGFKYTTQSRWTVFLNGGPNEYQVRRAYYAYPKDSVHFMRRTIVEGMDKDDFVSAEVMDCSTFIDNVLYEAFDLDNPSVINPTGTTLYRFLGLNSEAGRYFKTEVLRGFAVEHKDDASMVRFYGDDEADFKSDLIQQAFMDGLERGDVVGVHRDKQTTGITLSDGHVLLYVGDRDMLGDDGQTYSVRCFVHCSNLNLDKGFSFDQNDTGSRGAVMYIPLDDGGTYLEHGVEKPIFEQNFMDVYYRPSFVDCVYTIDLIKQLAQFAR